jgi:phosphate transport system substrate-binding protein
MRAVPIVQNGKAVLPSIAAVVDGSYQPLSRPLFIYVNAAAAQRPEVQRFVEFYLTEGRPLASETGFVPLPESAAQLALQHFRERRLGTVFGGVPEVGVTIDALLARESKL